jgi:hypothetical protein
VAAVTINAFAATAVASAAPAAGGLPLRVIGNQLEYCALICPLVVQGAATVPAAIGTAPATFVGALLSSLSLVAAAGAAAAPVSAAVHHIRSSVRDPVPAQRTRVIPPHIGSSRRSSTAPFSRRCAVLTPTTPRSRSPDRGTPGSSASTAGWPTYSSLLLRHSYLITGNNRWKN